VWALGIEFPDEIVEAGLLLEAIDAWRADGLFLEGQNNALMAPVLLRATWFDALDIDTEPQPPEGEFRLKRAFGLAKGTPLSERMASGKPRSRNRRSKAVIERSSRVDSLASRRDRLAIEDTGEEAQAFVHDRTLFPRHPHPPQKAESVTHVSGTNCHLCLGPLSGLRRIC
jgi:hypothetical protein